MGIQLCPHKTNPLACPMCFRNKPPEGKPPPAHPGVRPGIPLAPVMAVGEATMRATQARAVAAQPAAVANGRTFKEPFNSGHHSPPPEAFNSEKVWEPPNRKELIDLQPRHPHIDKSIMK